MIRYKKSYSISIILPILNEISSLKKTIKILEKIKVKKEYLIIFSSKLTNPKVIKEISKLKLKYKNLKYFSQIRPFVGGAIDLGIKLSKNKYTYEDKINLNDNKFFTIQVGDGTLRRTCVLETIIQGDVTRLGTKLRNINRFFVLTSFNDRKFVFISIENEACCFTHG